MSSEIFLHEHPDFSGLLRIVADEKSIAPALVEKDYWIMHCLYGLQKLEYSFELKGGTSLSKGFGIIHRFSEDIDIRIKPPTSLNVKSGKNHSKPAHIKSRESFYDWLAENTKINGIEEVVRDKEFDDRPQYRSGGIRLNYKTTAEKVDGLKEGILLEVGFDDVTPNVPKTISSWAYEAATGKVEVIDNRAKNVACYSPGYTFVEKLQTISTKFRQQQEKGSFPTNFLRHYYDVYCLLQDDEVKAFIGTEEYKKHKDKRFRSGDNQVIAENEAFFLSNSTIRNQYRDHFLATRALYYKDQPDFDEILAEIEKNKSLL